MSLKTVILSNQLILCHWLLPLPSSFPSITVFCNKWTLCIKWPKYWSFSLSISPSNEYSGLISFRIEWFDLLAVQGTHKSLIQDHNSNTSFLRPSDFFMEQQFYPYMTTKKGIDLTKWIFVSEVMSLSLNTLSRIIITFYPRIKCLLISWLQSPSTEKICHCFHFFHVYLPWSDGNRCHYLRHFNVEF